MYQWLTNPSTPHFTPKYPRYRGDEFTFTIIGLRA
ncbi:hypothetical protein PQZ65_gp15 [Klebsiella phage 1611E-K2-1]|nr:hypothetical protein PQZ65_gp15 [Klebsiella phage 1611E-K2-1]